MVDRYRVWLGAGMLAGGVSAAMLAGAGVAIADDGSSSTSGAQASSGSDESDAAKPRPKGEADADRPGANGASDSSDSDDDADSSTGGGRHVKDDADVADIGTEPSAGDVTESDPDDSSEDGSHKPDADFEPAPEDEADVEETSDAPVADTGGGKHRAPETDVDMLVTKEEAPVSESDVDVPVTEEAPVSEAADDAPSTFVTSIDSDLSSEGAVVMRAAAADLPWLGDAPPELVDFFTSAASMVYNFYTSTMQFLAGPVRAPLGSNVRVESSTLTIGNGVVVPADWYFPEGKEPATGLIYFQHGFLATASFYSATAAYLAEKTNSIVIAPTLTWNIFDTANYPLMLPETHRAIADLFTGGRAALVASAQSAGFAGQLPTRLVLAGHSAGGGLVTGAAGYLAELGETDDLAGVMMFDGVSYLDNMSLDLAKIPLSIPVYNLAGEPYTWNTYGDANIRLAQARPDMFTGVVVAGGKHSDSMQSSSGAVQFAAYLATGFSSQLNIMANEIFGAGWVNDMFNGTHTTKLYGSPGSTINVLTGWWTTSAQVLPVPTVKLSFVDEVYACLLNPTTVNCTYLPFWGMGQSAATPVDRSRTLVA